MTYIYKYNCITEIHAEIKVKHGILYFIAVRKLHQALRKEPREGRLKGGEA